MSIDTKAFRSLSYGLYIISTKHDGRDIGCVVNTFSQVTSKPPQVSVAVNKENLTSSGIAQTGRFIACALDESAPMELISTFGFHSSADTDKFDGITYRRDEHGIAYPAEHTAARFSVEVTKTIDLGSHLLFIGIVDAAEPSSSKDAPMTYAYYHQVKGGKTPPKASSYNGGLDNDSNEHSEPGKKRIAWRCLMCGHIEYADELPDGFKCPICGAAKELFERIEIDA